jgi:hypothetical protein
VAHRLIGEGQHLFREHELKHSSRG